MNENDIVKTVKDMQVATISMQFTDIFGILKQVEIPVSQIDKALAGEIMFDGSSIEGFVRIEESDMYLKPDPNSFVILPWKTKAGRRTARLICDIYTPESVPFTGDPRYVLKRIIKEAADMGFVLNVGPEPEFFLFQGTEALTQDKASYFDLTPSDKGEEARADMVMILEEMGFNIEASHHEVAPSQHEIDFKYADALSTADNIVTFRNVVRTVALRHGLYATFMPKPLYGQNGSGMHLHQSLFSGKTNIFFDERANDQLGEIAKSYMAGIMTHAPAITAIVNPLVNSYKRLVPGYEAPVYIAWSYRNRSPLIRIPQKRGLSTRIELRSPDPACNPYLAIAVSLKAGLDGIKRGLIPPPPVNENIYRMTPEERRKRQITNLPGSLAEAIVALEQDALIITALGEHIAKRYVEAKRIEWEIYRAQVSSWELDEYLGKY